MSKVEEPQAQYQAQPKREKITLEAYLEMISDGTLRLEYHDGEVINIQSATEEHGKICTNLTRLIGNCLLDIDCDVYVGDRELWVPACRKMYYPDLMIVFGEHKKKKMSDNIEATLNPSVVIEVLSNSTEKYDLTKKSQCYKKVESIKQIVFVRQDQKYIAIHQKIENQKDWLYHEYSEDEDEVHINDCKILLNDIYRRVVFVSHPQQASDF
jgi:Uma2 family endonuclease